MKYPNFLYRFTWFRMWRYWLLGRKWARFTRTVRKLEQLTQR